VASEDGDRGQIEKDGSSPGTKPIDSFVTSLSMSVFIGLVWLAMRLIGWRIRRRVVRVGVRQSRARPYA
jgi:hypothetical protein